MQNRKAKYNNRRTRVNGIVFASKLEAEAYIILLNLQKAGKISGLELQPKYCLLPSFRVGNITYRRMTYSPDFQYITNKGLTVVDIKGVETSIFTIKRKMLLYKYPSIRFFTIKALEELSNTL